MPGTREYKEMDEAAVGVHVLTLQREIQEQGFDPLPAEVAAEVPSLCRSQVQSTLRFS